MQVRNITQSNPIIVLLTVPPIPLAPLLNHWFWEVHLLQDHRSINGAQGVSCGGVLQADDGDDVTGLCLLDLFTLVGMHQDHAAHAFLALAPAGFVKRGLVFKRNAHWVMFSFGSLSITPGLLGFHTMSPAFTFPE